MKAALGLACVLICGCAAAPARRPVSKLNDMAGLDGERVSRGLVLLPADRSQAGTVSFEIESGPNAGFHECEALGRGATSRAPVAGWISGTINGTTIYYAPMDAPNGATVPGIYDARNITSETYDIELLNSSVDLRGEETLLARLAGSDGKPKPYYSGVWKHWYSKTNDAEPIDMIWSKRYQPLSQGAALPVYAQSSSTPTAVSLKQLRHDPNYYHGPYGRSGFALHTDRWEDPDRIKDPAYAGRPELSDFRFRDTNGCVKVRPACLLLLNEFVDEQSRRKRHVQLEVREIPSQNGLRAP